MISKKYLQEAFDQFVVVIVESICKIAVTKNDLKALEKSPKVKRRF